MRFYRSLLRFDSKSLLAPIVKSIETNILVIKISDSISEKRKSRTSISLLLYCELTKNIR